MILVFIISVSTVTEVLPNNKISAAKLNNPIPFNKSKNLESQINNYRSLNDQFL